MNDMKQGDALSLPKGWVLKTINQISENLDSKRVPITKNIRSNGKIPYYGASGIVDYVENYLFDEDLLLISEDGANLLARTYPIAFSISGKTWVNNHAHVLKFNNSTTQKFVEIYIESIKLDDFVSGMAQPKLNQSTLNKIPIPIPPIPEQQRIVSILDKAFSAIERSRKIAEQNLKNAKELFESYLQGVFENKGEGWEEKTLGEVCEYDKTSNKRDDLPYVGLEDIQSNTGIFIGPFEPRRMKSLTFYFNNEHVLYGRLRPYLNKVLLPDFEGHCSTEIFPIKPKRNVLDRGFLFQWLIASETMKKINATWTGATLPRANMNAVLEFKINLPSFKAQQRIVHKLDALSAETKRLEAIYQQKINNLEELKKSILQKAFAGELKTEKEIIH